jgi:putative transport protein
MPIAYAVTYMFGTMGLLNALRNHPELAILLTLARGFVIGQVRVKSFKLGNVVGTLIAGVSWGNFRSSDATCSR